MIRNLKGVQGQPSLEADVHVVGAGIAGLLIATRLAKAGLRTIVSESGDERQTEETHPLNDMVHLRSVYAGANHGRFRCLGGTSTRWGGAMLPLLSTDLQRGGWPIANAELLSYQAEVESLFGLPSGPYDAADFVQSSDGARPAYMARFAKWPPFSKRNVAQLLAREIASPKGPELWLNATVTGFSFRPDGRLDAVTAQAPDGGIMTVRARETVLAAGAIESTRLLLLADKQHSERIFRPDDVLGRYFHDHLSVHIGSIQPNNRSIFNRTFGFRFEKGGMRNIRFEPAEMDRPDRLPPSFAHIAFSVRSGSPFDALREAFREVQRGRLPQIQTLARLSIAAPWLVHVAYWRYVLQRLLYPPDAAIDVNMVIEQEQRADNRITLATDQYDQYGQLRAAIDWSISPTDETNLIAAANGFLGCWERSTLADYGAVHRRNTVEAVADLAKGADVYHPCGSTRMGVSPADGVVDSNLRTFRVPNLTVAATSVFPSVGGANPTMTLMMAALRAADRLVLSAKAS